MIIFKRLINPLLGKVGDCRLYVYSSVQYVKTQITKKVKARKLSIPKTIY